MHSVSVRRGKRFDVARKCPDPSADDLLRHPAVNLWANSKVLVAVGIRSTVDSMSCLWVYSQAKPRLKLGQMIVRRDISQCEA